MIDVQYFQIFRQILVFHINICQRNNFEKIAQQPFDSLNLTNTTVNKLFRITLLTLLPIAEFQLQTIQSENRSEKTSRILWNS